MPKQVDHEERRAALARSVWQVVAERGLPQAGLRDVAAAAGVSMGTVQHYFGSRDQMLARACEELVRLAEQGFVARRAAPDRPEVRHALRDLAEASLPLDDDQRLGASVWHAFVAAAVREEALAASVRRAWDGARAVVVDELGRAVDLGVLPASTDLRAAADGFLALVDGLVVHRLAGHHDTASALAAVDHHLDLLLGGPAGPSR